jgi:predicted phosphoadenosine phosphosulfate sulfurtransferase
MYIKNGMRVAMTRKILVCFAMLLPIISGCGMQKKIKSTDVLQQQEIIAKFADLPDAPFQVQLQKIAVSSEDHDQLQVFYTVTMPAQELIAFYQQQMERLGWELLAESTTQDWLMHYVKPHQVCSILISQNHLSIYICNKKGA